MKNKTGLWTLIAAAALLLIGVSDSAFAHARLAFPGTDPQVGDITPRNSNPGLKAGACGGVARGATNKVLTAGATINLRWVETVNHPGTYHFDFSPAGDTNWVRLKSVVDDQNAGGTPHSYSSTLTVPNTVCENCTIRLVQEMTNTDPPSFYYSCSDIKIQATTGGGGGGGTGGGNEVPDDENDPGAGPGCHP